MATLSGQTIANTYTMILKMADTGIDGTLNKIESGDADDGALALSTTAIGIDTTDKMHFDGIDGDFSASNTYIHEAGADRLDFVVGGDTNGFVLLEGSGVTKVGIGLAAPSANLHIYRNTSDETSLLRLEEDGAGDAKMAYTLSGSSAWQTGIDNTDNAFKIAAQETGAWTDTRLTILTDGNVGIGTTTPYSPLHIKSAAEDDLDGIADGGTAIPQVLIEGSGDTAGDNSPILCLHNSSTGTDNDFIGRIAFTAGDDDDSTPADPSQGTEYASIVARISDVTDNTTDGLLYFYTDVNNTATQTMALKGGNVGIGTASPYSKLHVSGGDIELDRHDSDVGQAIRWGDGGTEWNTGPKIASIYHGASDADEQGLGFYVHDSATAGDAATLAMTIMGKADKVGYVGIGDADPGYQLDVAGTEESSFIAVIDNKGSGNGADVLILRNAHATHPTNTNVYIAFNDAGGTLDTLRGDGSGGVEETWTDASDARIKENINDLIGGLDKINALRPVSFNYTEDYINGKVTNYCANERWKHIEAGFIAQEFEAQLPVSVKSCIETVSEDITYDGASKVVGDEVEVKKIDIKNNQIFQAYLVKAIQELSAKVEALENA